MDGSVDDDEKRAVGSTLSCALLGVGKRVTSVPWRRAQFFARPHARCVQGDCVLESRFNACASVGRERGAVKKFLFTMINKDYETRTSYSF